MWLGLSILYLNFLLTLEVFIVDMTSKIHSKVMTFNFRKSIQKMYLNETQQNVFYLLFNFVLF